MSCRAVPYDGMTKPLHLALPLSALLLSACAGQVATRSASSAPVSVKIIAFNDLHGNLEPPKMAIEDRAAGARVPAGGVAYMATAIAALKAQNPNHVVVSAGDMIGASPLMSALFLDEPTIEAMNLVKMDFNAVGNHEFDKGRAELLRMQNGGCHKFTPREPCQVSTAFPGASFSFLAANTITENGSSLFPATGLRSFGTGKRKVTIGFIGMTLKETPTVVTPAGVAGLDFRDEADTANALIPALKAKGADAIVVLIHQGGSSKVGYNDKSCDGFTGDLLPILERLDASVDLVVSGHTHKSYVCDYGKINPAKPFLVTSGGQYGTLLTDITLDIDPMAGKVVGKRADNIIVQGEGYPHPKGDVAVDSRYTRYAPDAVVAGLISRYSDAAKARAGRVVGKMSAPAFRQSNLAGESAMGNIIADAQLAATRDLATGGAQIAFMNSGGIRADLVPQADGSVSYGALFAVQPFGNMLVVKTFTGRQIRNVLEQQFDLPDQFRILSPSTGFTFTYDTSRPAGGRILSMMLNGVPVADEAKYRVTTSNFLASGGDRFTGFAAGTNPNGGMQDVDALEAYIAAKPLFTPPPLDRVTNRTP